MIIMYLTIAIVFLLINERKITILFKFYKEIFMEVHLFLFEYYIISP